MRHTESSSREWLPKPPWSSRPPLGLQLQSDLWHSWAVEFLRWKDLLWLTECVYAPRTHHSEWLLSWNLSLLDHQLLDFSVGVYDGAPTPRTSFPASSLHCSIQSWLGFSRPTLSSPDWPLNPSRHRPLGDGRRVKWPCATHIRGPHILPHCWRNQSESGAHIWAYLLWGKPGQPQHRNHSTS